MKTVLLLAEDKREGKREGMFGGSEREGVWQRE